MDLGQRKVGVLKMHFLRAGTVGQFIQDDLNDLPVRDGDPGDTILVEIAMSILLAGFTP